MNNQTTLMAAIGLGLIMTTTSVSAQQSGRSCAPREKVIERLADGFGETRHSVGLGANNVVVETFASSETGTWTITVTMPTGMTCLVASGQAFETASVALPEAQDPDL